MPAANQKVKNNELDLSNQGLKEIPFNVLAAHKNVTSINLSNNKITSVGKGLGTLSQLVRLDLGKNQIKGLPENIGNLTHLKYLNLSNNKISVLPTTLGHLKSLKHLDLRNNPLAPKFAEVVGPCANEGQCQQAARNVLKAYGGSAENDKKKKQKEQSDQNAKKAKNAEKSPPNGLSQPKQKAKSKSKKHQSVLSKAASFFITVGKYSLVAITLSILSLYALSYYDEKWYDSLKFTLLPLWDEFLTRYLSQETATKITDALARTGRLVHNVLVFSVTFVIQNVRGFYAYVTTDKTFLLYVESLKIGLNNLWLRVTEIFTGAAEQSPQTS